MSITLAQCKEIPGLYYASLNGVELPMKLDEAEALRPLDQNKDCRLDENDFGGDGTKLAQAYVEVKKKYSPEQWGYFNADKLFRFTSYVHNASSYLHILQRFSDIDIKGSHCSAATLSFTTFYSAATWNDEVLPLFGGTGSVFERTRGDMCDSFRQLRDFCSGCDSDFNYELSAAKIAAAVPSELVSPFVREVLNKSNDYTLAALMGDEPIKRRVECEGEGCPEEDSFVIEQHCEY